MYCACPGYEEMYRAPGHCILCGKPIATVGAVSPATQLPSGEWVAACLDANLVSIGGAGKTPEEAEASARRNAAVE